MNDAKLIGILGFIGSGKGTVTSYLVEKYGYKNLSFAGPLKDITSILFGWDREKLEGATKESREWREQVDLFWTQQFGYDVTPRKILQLIGTEAMRNVIHPNIWVSIVKNIILQNPNQKYVISDLRFPNEIEMVEDLNGKILRIQRGPNPEWYDLLIQTKNTVDPYEIMKPFDIHESEWRWIGVSNQECVIHNDSTIENLHREIDNTLNS